MSGAVQFAAPAPAAATRAAVPSVPMPLSEIFELVTESIEAGRLDRAERLLGHVLAVAPAQPDALHMSGLIAFRRKKLPEAAALMERSVAQGARKPAYLRNLSELYRVLGRLDDAVAYARQAVSGDPADPLSSFNLAMVYYDRMEIPACLSAARHAVELRPSLPQAHMKLGQAYLLQGEMERGWDEYEWRYQIPGAQALMPKTERPQWDGAPMPDQKLLLVADQGFGDVVMFARYIPWVLERCPDVVVACSIEMFSILKRTYPGVTLFTRWDECPVYAAFCPFSGLPRLHGTRLDNIPAAAPYLAPEADRAAIWGARLAERIPAGMLRVGIAWAGRPTHNNDHNRTVHLSIFAPLAQVPGVVFVSLQKGDDAAQVASWPGPAPLIDLNAELETFEDTMAVMSHLDLLITVDTALGHFAGAMGVAAWVMVPFAPDWRWLRDRTDTPWYRTLRLFRHPATRRWDLVIPAVTAALEQRVAGGG